MIYLRKKVGGLREIIYGFCTVKATNLFQNQETSFYEKQESSFYENKKLPSTEKQETSFYRKQEIPSTGTISFYEHIWEKICARLLDRCRSRESKVRAIRGCFQLVSARLHFF